MRKRIKKTLKKTMIFAVTVSTMLAGAGVLSILPWVKISEKIKERKANKEKQKK